MDKNEIKSRMDKTLSSLQEHLLGLRAGRVSPAIVSKVVVEAYGSQMAVPQLANVAAPDGRTLVIEPWDKSVLSEIVKALQAANLGANPISDGNLIRMPFPPLSQERRKELVKLVDKTGEDSKVAIRNIRRDFVASEKKAEKDGDISEDELKKSEGIIQEVTDEYTKKIDDVISAKKREILES
ncbi:MAG TPA: ribosome recycling factor [Caldisericia bacterium]|nr:ribosome recycling factor [Caldisericia bacterium]HPF49580.1 ribosome recycling factor [Caldisericia bacterium]HPI84504.1 ribosome recycling factor [Caldisericia bacterium]HPQ93870.1 ribosome recycling factor [Caldisericia bacterium]HRV75415.1 ribosome recycling factor [Caldisericia bacterium]